MVNPRLINLAERIGNDVPPKEEVPVEKPEPDEQPKISNAKDYVVLENIICRDAEGKVFEQYPQLLVKKDIERDDKQKQINHNPYEWVQYFEDKGLFLPSFALSCNVLAALYGKRNDPEINKVLMQYKDYGPGYGWQAQNTVVDWRTNTIIHYPDDAGAKTPRQPTRLSFKRKGIKDMPLEKALKNEDYRAYVQNLTGLAKPEVLVEIGKYFGKPAHIWTSGSRDVRAAWLGCYFSSFDFYADYVLYSCNAARGVLIKRR